MTRSHTCRATLCLRLSLIPCALVMAALVFWFAWLKETPLFWRNAGGYPLWMRELVLEAFYPVLALHLLLLVLLSFSFLVQPSRGWLCCIESVLAVVLWTMMAATAAVVVTNNVANLLEGRPLHSHPEETAMASRPVFYRLQSL